MEETEYTKEQEELWGLFLEVASPQQEFADTAHDNKRAIINALEAVYTKGFNDSMR